MHLDSMLKNDPKLGFGKGERETYIIEMISRIPKTTQEYEMTKYLETKSTKYMKIQYHWLS